MTPVLTAALLTVAKTWKQPTKCLSIDEWIMKMWCVNTHIHTHTHTHTRGFPTGSVGENPPAMQEPQEMWVWSLGQEDPLQESMATHSSILTWRIPWTEDLVGYSPQSRKKLDMTEVIEHSQIHQTCNYWGQVLLAKATLLEVIRKRIKTRLFSSKLGIISQHHVVLKKKMHVFRENYSLLILL